MKPITTRRPPRLNLIAASLLLAFSTGSQAAGIIVDGTAYSNSGLYATPGNNNPALQIINAGEATWSEGYLSASGVGSSAAVVQGASTLNLINTTLATLQVNTPALDISGGSLFNTTNSQVTALGNSIALNLSGTSQISGNGLKINSEGSGLRVIDSQVDVSNLSIKTNGVNGNGIYVSGTSSVDIDGGSISTSNTGGHGIYADGGNIRASNMAIVTTGASARGVLASGAATHVTLDGGSINTSGRNGYGIQATLGATVEVSNMDITATQPGQSGAGGGAALFADRGASVKAETLNLSSTGNAIWINNARVDGNNLHLQQTSDVYGR